MQVPCLHPEASLTRRLVLLSFPQFLILVFFYYAGYLLWTYHPCVQSMEAQESEFVDDQMNESAEEICDSIDMLKLLIVLILFVTLVWTTVGIYLAIYIPRQQRLLQQYLNEGQELKGNVWCMDSTSCTGASSEYKGCLIYQHVNYKVYPVYVRREVRLLNHISRENETILVLPGKAMSGQPKDDVMLLLEEKQSFLETNNAAHFFVWFWAACSSVSPIYALFILDDLNEATGRPNVLNWVLYVIGVVLVIPSLAFALNEFVYSRHYAFMVLSGTIAEDGGLPDSTGCGWYDLQADDDDDDDEGYVPPDEMVDSSDENSVVSMNVAE